MLARNDLLAGSRINLPILAEPMRCRALRTLRVVSEDVGTSGACRCPLAEVGGSYVCAPMQAAGSTVGVVTLQATDPGTFTSAVQRRVQASLGFGAPALASLRLLAATRERALRDPLTGAYNRAYLAEHLDEKLELATRRGEGLGVLMIDLDHFKKLNDTHGHAAGDRALVAAVEALQGEVRSGDVVVRQGGEELVVTLLDTDLGGAVETAERLRRAIEGIQLTSERGAVPVRASIGVAVFPDHGTAPTALLDAADRALYQAKSEGRNRVAAAHVLKAVPTAIGA
jgi:diguanylate cyclase (GGDEF)-like protein